VSLWTDNGTLLISQVVPGPSLTWNETALPVPVTLAAGSRYRIGVYTGGTEFCYRYDGVSTFEHGTIDGAYESYGDTFPRSQTSLRWPLVDLRYTVQEVQPVALTPGISGAFVNGTWAGSVVLPQGAALFLRAADNNGHTGSSGQFDTISTRLGIQLAGDSVILWWPTNATGLLLESAVTLKDTVLWSPVTNAPSTVGDQLVVTNSLSGEQRFFRLRSQ
jgi:hypothetical protein